MSVLEGISVTVQTLAILAAGAYFVYRFGTASLAVNMSVELQTTRTASSHDGYDWLVIVAHLTKGDRGGVLIEDAAVRIRFEGEEEVERLVGINRLNHRYANPNDPNTKMELDFTTVSPNNPFIRFPPGESTAFASVIEIPRGACCLIDLAIIGRTSLPDVWRRPAMRNRRPGTAQWRASAVAPPRTAAPTATPPRRSRPTSQ